MIEVTWAFGCFTRSTFATDLDLPDRQFCGSMLLQQCIWSFTLTSCSVPMTRLTDGAECLGHGASCSRNIKLSWKPTINKQRVTLPPPLIMTTRSSLKSFFSGLVIYICDNEDLEDLVCRNGYFMACSRLRSSHLFCYVKYKKIYVKIDYIWSAALCKWQVSEKEEIFLGQTSLIIAQVIPLHHRLNVALIMMPS